MQLDVEGKFCCGRCFQHRWLQEYVHEHSRAKGMCHYCGTRHTPLIAVGALSKYFANLLKMYQPSEGVEGDPLWYILQDHWRIFDEKFAEEGGACELITDIMMGWWDDDDGEPPVDGGDLYVSVHSSVGYLERFDEFIERCREAGDAIVDFPEILDEDIRRFEQRVPPGSNFYRARHGASGTDGEGNKLPWSGTEIGASPKGNASRANREGKIVLYSADTEKTAIAETRPARGFLVTVGELRVTKPLCILDLTKAQESLNPFLEEGETIPYWLELDELLSRIAWRLAMPLERGDSQQEYVPSQRLSEYAERVGFDGIRYPSAMLRSGTNVVFFDPTACEVSSSRLVKVTSLDIEYGADIWMLTDDYSDL